MKRSYLSKFFLLRDNDIPLNFCQYIHLFFKNSQSEFVSIKLKFEVRKCKD